MNSRSSKCKHKKKIQKMGGIICAHCRLTDPECVLLDGKCDCPYTEDKGYRYPKCKKNYDEF